MAVRVLHKLMSGVGCFLGKRPATFTEVTEQVYQRGKVRQLNPGYASDRLLRAATSGNPRAQYMLGLMLLNGTGVDPDLGQAVGWIFKAAEQGLPQAQNDLATFYAQGRGLRRDLHQALFWLRRAADQGLPVARENLERLRLHSLAPVSLHSSATPSPD